MTAIDDLTNSAQHAMQQLSQARTAIYNVRDEVRQQSAHSGGVIGLEGIAAALDRAVSHCEEAFGMVDAAWRQVGECVSAIGLLRTANEKGAVLKALDQSGRSLEEARQATVGADQALEQAIESVRAALDGGGPTDESVNQAAETARRLVSEAVGILNIAMEVNTDTQAQAN